MDCLILDIIITAPMGYRIVGLQRVPWATHPCPLGRGPALFFLWGMVCTSHTSSRSLAALASSMIVR